MSQLPIPQFEEISQLIAKARSRALRLVNQELVILYWEVGKYIHERVTSAEWGEGIVKELAEYLQKRHPGLRGFSRRGLFRMKQFFETYQSDEKVSAVLTQIPWTHHLFILSRTNSQEERQFYLQKCLEERYSSRELERQIKSGLYERSQLASTSLSPSLLQDHPEASTVFRDPYVLEFLDLPPRHSEKELQKAIIKNLGAFILEMGRDFSLIGEQYRVQVGMEDFYLDLLLFHRGLQCLVAIELKIEHFRPEHLGQLTFYLEALDRDVRKPHENPSVGIILCKSKDEEVVEYALSRQLSPALVAEYRTQLIDKATLRDKLHELFLLAESGE
ncbi:MAG: PDDEXK nuclease domain-containing protein [Bacteroidota bacterium]